MPEFAVNNLCINCVVFDSLHTSDSAGHFCLCSNAPRIHKLFTMIVQLSTHLVHSLLSVKWRLYTYSTGLTNTPTKFLNLFFINNTLVENYLNKGRPV